MDVNILGDKNKQQMSVDTPAPISLPSREQEHASVLLLGLSFPTTEMDQSK